MAPRCRPMISRSSMFSLHLLLNHRQLLRPWNLYSPLCSRRCILSTNQSRFNNFGKRACEESERAAIIRMGCTGAQQNKPTKQTPRYCDWTAMDETSCAQFIQLFVLICYFFILLFVFSKIYL